MKAKNPFLKGVLEKSTEIHTIGSHFGSCPLAKLRGGSTHAHMTKRTWNEEYSCYRCQNGGQKRECSVLGCNRHDDEGKVKKMTGDEHVGRFYCPYHWYIACWQQYQQKCLCRRCQVVALEVAAKMYISLAPAVPESVLQAASQAPVANELIVQHVVVAGQSATRILTWSLCSVQVLTAMRRNEPSSDPFCHHTTSRLIKCVVYRTCRILL